MKPLELLFERHDLPAFGLSPALAARYGGDFGISRPRLYANFVSSVDGVVSLRDAGESGRVVSGGSEADRFVMALLRASADAVLIGAGTLRHATGDLWHPEHAYPDTADLFAGLRMQLGLRPKPLLVVLTASGQIDTAQIALTDALIVTTPAGEARLRGSLPVGARLAVLDSDHVGAGPLMDRLHDEGLHTVLTEGGPSLVGQLMEEGRVDELFLTVSPKVFGRSEADGRKSLIEGIDLAGRALQLLSARRDGSHLFLRYAMR